MLTQELLTRLDQLAATLGTTTEKLWAVLVKQGKVEGIFAGLTSFVTIFLFIALYASLKRVWPEDEEDQLTAVLFGGVAMFILIIILYFNLYNTITYLFNPEYFAISKLVSIFK